jgi:hypothetical protein
MPFSKCRYGAKLALERCLGRVGQKDSKALEGGMVRLGGRAMQESRPSLARQWDNMGIQTSIHGNSHIHPWKSNMEILSSTQERCCNLSCMHENKPWLFLTVIAGH